MISRGLGFFSEARDLALLAADLLQQDLPGRITRSDLARQKLELILDKRSISWFHIAKIGFAITDEGPQESREFNSE